MGGGVGAAFGGAGAGLAGNLIGGNFASKAASKQRKGLSALSGQIQSRVAEDQARLDPFAQVGTEALSPLTGLILGKRRTEEGEFEDISPQERQALFQESPAFQFQLEEGQKALERLGSATGNIFSGRQIKATQRFGQGLASQDYQNYLGQLSSLANMGQSAATQQGNFSMSALSPLTQIGMGTVSTLGTGTRAAGQAFGQFGQDLKNIGGFASTGGFGAPSPAPTTGAGGF
jgi:hypothetical protein